MPRIKDDVIDRIKNEVSLIRLAEAQGHTLKKHGKDFILSCPFHDDKTPSLVISPANNLWNCLGACQSGGDVIEWVMKTHGISFRHAVEILQNDLGLITETKTVKKCTTKKLDSPLTADANDQKLLHQVVDYYHQTLKQHSEISDYLDSRGINEPELVEQFKLGYANRSLGYRLPEKNRKAGAEIRGRLETLGIYRKSGHEHLNGSLVIPILDENNQITEIYGRKLGGNRLRKGTVQHLYLPGPHQGVWNIEAFKSSDEIILCEALIDAMTFWVNGFRYVTASYGTSGFTNDHLAALKSYKIKRVLIAYDRDEAGDNAANQLADKLIKEGIDCYRVQFPKGMDANEYALKLTPAKNSLGLVLRKAVWLGKGQAPKIDKVERIDIETGEVITESVEKNGDYPLFTQSTRSAHGAGSAAKEKMVETPQAEVIDPDLMSTDGRYSDVPGESTSVSATPVPTKPTSSIDAEIKPHETIITLGEMRYRIRGLDKNLSYDHLKVNLMVNVNDNFHTDKLDFYNAKARTVFINQASVECGVKTDVIKKDLGKILLKLESLQDELIQKTLTSEQDTQIELNDHERQAALELLNDKNLLNRILEDFNAAGVVGETTNKLCGYLACVSRKLDKPLAIMIQSSSAAGKSSLMDAVLAMMPEEERIQYSAMTGQSLFYMGETQLKHKILAIAEEEGAHNASYALKLLQSEGEVSIASTAKDETTGNLVTKEYKVEGPVMLFLTTTAIEIDEELLNRCLVLTVNESREQTEAIHQAQRMKRTLKGLQAKVEKNAIISLHRNAQRLLKSLAVINPYADQLTFLSDKTRTRRDHEKYLTLIDSIALLHQYQRKIKTIDDGEGGMMKYIEVTLNDIKIANELAHEVLGKTLDELPPQTRNLLKKIQTMVMDNCKQKEMEQTDYRFSRKQIRGFTGWTDNQLKVHCRRLEEMEYLLVHRGGRGQSMEYELLYNGSIENESALLMGLIDIEKLTCDAKKLGKKDKKLDSSCTQVGAKLAQSWEGQTKTQFNEDKACSELEQLMPENVVISKKNNNTAHQHRTDRLTSLAAN